MESTTVTARTRVPDALLRLVSEERADLLVMGAALAGFGSAKCTNEEAYQAQKFFRAVLGTNDVDFRARPHSAEEADFLASTVVATGPDGGAVTYADLDAAPTVLLVGLEPEEESPIVFLRLRKGEAFQRGPWHLGRWSYVVGWIAVAPVIVIAPLLTSPILILPAVIAVFSTILRMRSASMA